MSASIIVYKGKITSNLENCKEKVYIGISEGKFKTRYAITKNRSRIINTRKKQNYQMNWKLKELDGDPKVTFSILKKCHPFEPSSGKCY